MVASGRFGVDLEDMQRREMAKLPLPRERNKLQLLNEETNRKLTKAMKAARNDQLQEDLFTYSLNHCMD